MDDVTQISQLKYRYLRTLDTKQWDEFADCFVPDATGDYNGLLFDNRDALVSYMKENLPEGFLTMHQVHHPEIEVDGDTATGSWGFEDTVIVPDFKVLIRGAGYYRDTYRRDADGAWRIASTGYERIYEAMTSLEDTPSFKLIANRWDPELSH